MFCPKIFPCVLNESIIGAATTLSPEMFLLPAALSAQTQTIAHKIELLMREWNLAGHPELFGPQSLVQSIVCAAIWRVLRRKETAREEPDMVREFLVWKSCDVTVQDLGPAYACGRDNLRACSRVRLDASTLWQRFRKMNYRLIFR